MNSIKKLPSNPDFLDVLLVLLSFACLAGLWS
jgi:hypothetical protein